MVEQLAAGILADIDAALLVVARAAEDLVLAGYVAITLAAALSVAFRGDRQRSETGWRGIALRALGGWAAAAGLMMTGFTLAQAGTG